MKKNNYKKLGPYIREVDIRNKENIKDNLLGVSTKKIFIKSIANTIGTNFKKYKIVKRRQFTYVPDTSRRGDKIGLAMLEDYDTALVSQAYTVFEIINKDELLPEYLMMWFRRPEFDRYARYMSHGSVRELFGWEEMCEVELPVPTLEKQQEIVDEYNTIINRIKLNEQLNQKLEETAQTIYKEWFVNFEFPMTQEYTESIGKPELAGKPYKSNGGEMVWNEELGQEVPKGWSADSVGNIFKTIGGSTPSTEIEEYWNGGKIIWYSPTDVTNSKGIFSWNSSKKITNLGLQKSSAKKIPADSVLMTSRATVGKLIININESSTNQGFISIIPTKDFSQYFIFDWIKLKMDEILTLASGSTFNEISKTDFREIQFLLPKSDITKKHNEIVQPLFLTIKNRVYEIIILDQFKKIILSKMTKVGE